jgi:MFS family permease
VQRQVRADITPLPLVGARRGWVMAAALTAIFIDQSASSIASSTLSSVQGAFGLGPDEGSWFVTLENAPYYASIIASVWMVARIGRKPVLVASLLGYALFSLLCIVAPDATTLLVLRFLQGVAQGGIFTTALLVIFTMHKPREVAKALMPFSAASQAGGVLGPLVGGSLVEWGTGPTRSPGRRSSRSSPPRSSSGSSRTMGDTTGSRTTRSVCSWPWRCSSHSNTWSTKASAATGSRTGT